MLNVYLRLWFAFLSQEINTDKFICATHNKHYFNGKPQLYAMLQNSEATIQPHFPKSSKVHINHGPPRDLDVVEREQSQDLKETQKDTVLG